MNSIQVKKTLNIKDIKNIDDVKYKLIIENCDGYKEDGSVLFKFRKKVIPNELLILARKNFQSHSKTKNKLRHVASGNGICRSSISGYFDKPIMSMKKYFPSQNICRKTSFTKNKPKLWNESLPFFELIGQLYYKLSPNEYLKQMNAIKKVPKQYRIGSTPFTTITTNYNWQTHIHKDVGDFDLGLGNLTIVGDDTYKGGYLLFPEYQIAINVRPGDFLLMDVHEYHCNTKLIADDNNVRLSFVCYLRKSMMNCKKKIIINNETYHYK